MAQCKMQNINYSVTSMPKPTKIPHNKSDTVITTEIHLKGKMRRNQRPFGWDGNRIDRSQQDTESWLQLM